MTQDAHSAVQLIRQRRPNFTPHTAIVLGSGLGKLAQQIQNTTIIAYDDLPGFHKSTVAGHPGNLILGTLRDHPIACLQGRVHYYEGNHHHTIKTMIRTLRLLGCEIFLATNAAGSLHAEIPPGSLSLVKDHINFQFQSILVGPNEEEFGPRFLSMQTAYDVDLRKKMQRIAHSLNIRLSEGVYIGTIGPAFETPAEINAFRQWGADLVGMSTIPEVIVARHCQMRVLVISVVTNLAAGMTGQDLSHQETVDNATAAADKLTRLILTFIENFSKE